MVKMMKIDLLKFRNKLVQEHKTNRRVAEALMDRNGCIDKDKIISYTRASTLAEVYYDLITLMDDCKID